MNRRSVAALLLLLTSPACRPADPPAEEHEDHGHEASDRWAVTAWGERYEVFAETDVLVAGEVATSAAHVTILEGFLPLETGAVSAVLRGAGGREQRFRQDQMLRSGIFAVEIRPAAEGTFELTFAIERAGEDEEISAGRVRVGSHASPGGLVDASPEAPDGVSFLKEQQWRTEFATAWTEEGTLPESVAGPARVAPARGGALVLTASVDAVVAPEPWPHTGQDVAAGAVVFRLRPRAAGRSVPELAAEVSALEADAGAAGNRVQRLEELLKLEATSLAELERARADLAGIEARLTAARQGVAVVSGEATAGALEVRAPWAGRVAEVTVSPGESVSPGDVLGRLVKPRPLWIEVALRPEEVPRLADGVAGLILRRASVAQPTEVAGRALRLVAIAPEVDARTNTVGVTLEVDTSTSELPIGSAVEAEILLAGERPGVVVPESALVDDAGVTVAYVQDSGEAFSRREVRVLARLGTRVLVEGLDPGARLVTRGAAALRRSSLLSSGAPERHAH